MTSLQPFSLPPRWLPLHLLAGGLIAAGMVLLLPHQHPSLVPLTWARCASSLIVLAMGLLLALCLGLVVGLHARPLGSRAERLIALLGRTLACVPAVVLAWGFIAGWIGRLGLPVESLIPAQIPTLHDSLPVRLARTLWDFLAPAFILALPLCGEMIHGVITDGGSTGDLNLSLRARGVPKSSRLWRHRLSQLLPLLRLRMQSLCLIAPVYLIIIEDTLHFTGWGEALAQNLRAGAAGGIALGFVSGGAMLALLCAGLQWPRERLPFATDIATNIVASLAWQPWLLWTLGVMALLSWSPLLWITLWLALLMSGSAGWFQAWRDIEAKLPVDAARVFGASPEMIWRQHAARLQLRLLAAWLCAALAQTLLGIAAACALQPRLVEKLFAPLARLYRPLAISSAQDAVLTLTDPTALLQSGGGIALAALCLIQVSRIVQPRNL